MAPALPSWVRRIRVACGIALHLRAMPRTIGALTIVYVTAALWPWSILFNRQSYP